jgi:glycosyltransferase domain-containing protein
MSGVTTEGSSVKKTALATAQNTLVVLSRNQPDFLRRTLQYYRAYAGPMLVLDASIEAPAADDSLATNVTYLHVPQFAEATTADTFAHALGLVITPFVTLADVNDFLMEDALARSVSFLQDHPGYGFCHGYSLSYRAVDNQVDYFRRDKKVREEISAERSEDRVQQAMAAFISPLHAVTRTELLRHWYSAVPKNAAAVWQDIGLGWYLAASGKGRLLPVPYAVREVSAAPARQKGQVIAALNDADAVSRATRESFADFLVSMSPSPLGRDSAGARALVLDSFNILLKCVRDDTAAAHERIVESSWKSPLSGPVRRFGPNQYVEVPFYNQPFFDRLAEIEFLIGALPAGAVQHDELEGMWVAQQELLALHDNDTAQTITERLWEALDINVFNKAVVAQLAERLAHLNEPDEARGMTEWLHRLEAVGAQDRQQLLHATASGRLLNWLELRRPDADVVASGNARLAAEGAGPQFGIFLLDLDDDLRKLQGTLDSLIEGACTSFRIVVFTTGEPPVATSVQNTLHFVKVSKSNYVDKLNQIARQIASGWLLLVEAGDRFLPGALLRAALELQGADDVRAVAADEIHRQPNGTLKDVLRPGFNLDLLLRNPAQMARHWLIRKDVLLEAGGYSPDFTGALEFELLLRIIEKGGPSWLAHLDEPLLITDACELADNGDERLALTRYLTALGYKAQVTSGRPGTWQIDYRHSERPLVTLILPGQDNLESLQRCLTAILQRTRYMRYEVLIVDNQSQSPQVHEWLDRQQQNPRIRILRSDVALSEAALYNAASQQAQGEYLVLLSTDSEVVNPNWIDALLNHGMRPEVAVVGPKLVDRDGAVTNAGLILGMNGGVGSAFVGEPKEASGYLQRLVLEHNYSAVSGACVMVRKALFESVGGLDETDFGDAYAVVDFCLKIGQKGYLTVWTPQVQVYHPGSTAQAPSALARLQDKWAGAFAHDLAYNQNLSLSGRGFTVDTASTADWSQLIA